MHDLLPPLRILIVEDDPMMRLGLEQVLQNTRNLTLVGLAENGYEGIKAAKELQPDIVLMDINLPPVSIDKNDRLLPLQYLGTRQLDGIITTKLLKEIIPHLKVIMLTAYNTKTELVNSLSIGADAYCVKGGDLEQLFMAIATVAKGGTYIDPVMKNFLVESFQTLETKTERLKQIEQLSSQELKILKLIAKHYSNQQIAADLTISINTVKTHVRNIMHKLSISSKGEAIAIAIQAGLK